MPPKRPYGSYPAQERQWVKNLLARLTPEQQARYSAAMAAAPRHHSTGKHYDIQKARIAERIMYEDAVAQNRHSR